MNEDVIIVPIVFGLPTIAVVVRMLLRHREKMADMKRQSAPEASVIEERLARVESAIDAIAIEMERVGEGQRFLTKVLTQREQRTEIAGPASTPASRASSQVNTPH
ncbi:MAG TPA: hypothetical protein VH277_04185 [Gemmatimonadaceae bacterium]|jgi:hypothetical protein|nr:hypothetical protein [Gemmatimonadaceae bacterium]